MLLNNFVTSLSTPTDKLPLVDYKLSSAYQAGDGTRKLLDYGKSHSNADLYFGRGCAFNGVDQSLDTGTYSISGDTTISFTLLPNIASGQLCIFGLDRIMLHSNMLQMDLRGSGGLPDVYISSNLDVTKTYIISIVFFENRVETWLNGILDTVTITPTIGLSYRYIGQRGTDEGFLNSTLSNIVIINQALTPAEIAYQYTNPEKFLYHEKQADGTFVAKSEILSQDKIDNVVAHLPLTETDGYVRNMIGYSDGITISDIGGTYIAVEDEVATHTYADGVHTIEVTTAGTSNVRPYIKIDISQTLEIGNIYLYSFDVSVISGTFGNYTFHLNNGSKGTKTYTVSELSIYDVATAEYAHSELAFTMDGTNTFKIEISNIQVKKLTNTYQIANYTDAVRDNAKNLQSGLQTCFWKRDVLGVPIGSSFNELTVGGSDVTGCESLIVLPNTYSVEIVVSFDDITKYKNIAKFVEGVGITKYTTGKLYIYPRYDDSDYNLHVSSNTFINNQSAHVVFSIIDNGTTAISEVYHNGILVSSRTYDYTTRADVTIRRLFYNQYSADDGYFDVRLFKVHTTPQDPAKLYADAINNKKFGDYDSIGFIDIVGFDYETTDGLRTIVDGGTNE